MKTYITTARMGITSIGLAAALAGTTAMADQVILDDLIVSGSACIGFDCVNGESFGFDTLRLKENNLRIRAQDTSSSASFPSNDWQITFNDSANGGANKFSIDDIDAGRTPFTIEAGARANALYVDDGGRIGIGTATPSVNLHVKFGDSPTLRLEQDGSSGFTPQTWDIAGNETNFFVRDATNGSKLPFKIRPSAPTNSFYINTNGNIGLQTASPTASLHVRRTDATAKLLVEEASATTAARQMGVFKNNGDAYISLETTAGGAATPVWNIASLGGELRLVNSVGPDIEFALTNTGNLTISGTLTQMSDKTRKMAIVDVDDLDILTKVAALPISAWTYKADADSGIRHIGPMSQDFYALFGTGKDDKGISSIDTGGVALAAIKALSQQNTLLAEQNIQLQQRLTKLEQALTK